MASYTLKCSFIDIISLTYGVPEVKVPVLSNTMVVMDDIFSRISPPLIRTPKEAAMPVPTMTAVGVASPKAHGHAITSVEIAKPNANSNLVNESLSRIIYPASVNE